MFEAIIFDFDGTLLDSDKMIVVTFEQLYKIYKPNIVPDKNKLLLFSGPPIKESLLKEFPDANQKEALDNFLKLSEINYIKYVKPFPYVKEMLTLLKKFNIKTALVTSKARQATDFALKLTSLDGLFDFIICADEVKNVKPDPEGVLLALNHLNVKNKDNVVYIGDSEYDYMTAENAKLKFGFVTFSPRKLLANHKPDLSINDFETFTKGIINDEKN